MEPYVRTVWLSKAFDSSDGETKKLLLHAVQENCNIVDLCGNIVPRKSDSVRDSVLIQIKFYLELNKFGRRILDSPMDEEAESYDEAIVPSDYQVAGLIRDTLIFKTLLAPMRYGVTVTLLLDCCDTGMVLELPYSWSTKSDKRDHLAKV